MLTEGLQKSNNFCYNKSDNFCYNNEYNAGNCSWLGMKGEGITASLIISIARNREWAIREQLCDYVTKPNEINVKSGLLYY